MHYRVVVPLEQVDGRIVLVLQVSNFMHRMGGLWSPIVFGSYDYIKTPMTGAWRLIYSSRSLIISGDVLFGILFN